VSKRKECESSETTALLNKIHKSNEKLCFYCKKPKHFVRNFLKKKNDEKEKVNQACEDHEQMFVAALSANDHTTYDWIVDSGATQHMTFEQEWFMNTFPQGGCSWAMTPFWRPFARGASKPQCKWEAN
jgi:hypothetical protein